MPFYMDGLQLFMVGQGSSSLPETQDLYVVEAPSSDVTSCVPGPPDSTGPKASGPVSPRRRDQSTLNGD